jgi:hypothetical protein
LDDNTRLLKIFSDGTFSEFSSETTLSVATEWEGMLNLMIGVDIDMSLSESLRNIHGSVDVLGLDTWGETKLMVVGSFDNFINCFEFEDTHNWSEDFFSGNGHIVSDISKDGWLTEITWSVNSISS